MHHPFFGKLDLDRHHVELRPAESWPGVEYDLFISDTGAPHPLVESRLDVFAAFCCELAAKDAAARSRMSAWPPVIGELWLCRVSASLIGQPLPREDGAEAIDCPYTLYYRGFSEEAWAYAGISNYPPQVAAYFDETGEFVALDGDVDRALSALPQQLPKPQWAGGYSHPYFGTHVLEELTELTQARLGWRRKIPLDLYMSYRRMCWFQPGDLDQFVPVARSLKDLDHRWRDLFPEQLRLDWLEDRLGEWGEPWRDAMGQVFPKAKAVGEISRADFLKALQLRRGCFTFPDDKSDNVALTLDYQILAPGDDDNLFAVKFRLDGSLSEVVIES